MHVEVITTQELGDRSYVAHDGATAVVVDPQRDLDRVQAVLDRHRLSVALVCETHRHNDYLTGGYALARETGAAYCVPAEEDVVCDRRPVADGDVLAAGALSVRAVASPGHTLGHLAYLVGEPGGVPAVFSGGSLLYGSVGRTDLVDPDRTAELARLQYRSARRLAAAAPDAAAVYPTHGFGSFCSAGSAGGRESSTIGAEKAANDALTSDDEDAFVAGLLAGLTAYPTYYARMGPGNRVGPTAADLGPVARVDLGELRRRLAAGEWVVDLRHRRAYAAGHAAGTVGIELGTDFATYSGWLLPGDRPVTLLGGGAEEFAAAARQLARIGMERGLAASTAPAPEAGPAGPRSYRCASFADLVREAPERPRILDVRRDDERAKGGVPGSTHVPIHRVQGWLERAPDQVPDGDGPVWVFCASGYRASIAASLLDRAGHDVVLIDDDYGKAVELGLATG